MEENYNVLVPRRLSDNFHTELKFSSVSLRGVFSQRSDPDNVAEAVGECLIIS